MVIPGQRMTFKRAMKKYWVLYLMVLPAMVWYIVFKYIPMPTGLIISMEDYVPWKGLWKSNWVWFENYIRILTGGALPKVLRNTLLLSALSLVFAFPASIVLALLINELRNRLFKRTVQSVAYLPYFLSWTVVAGLAFNLMDTRFGLFNQVLKLIGLDPVRWYATPSLWPAILTVAKIWKTTGWGTIVFLAAICAIDTGLYEAAVVDGAGRWQQTLHVTIPAIMPTIIVTFILSIGQMLASDSEMIMAMVGNNEILWETAQTFETFVTNNVMHGTYASSATLSMLQNTVTFFMVWGANTLANRRESGSGIW